MSFPDRGTFLESGLTFLSPYGLPADQAQCFICFNPYMPDDRSMDPTTEAAFELPEAPVRLPCGHIFGLDCIRRWTDPEQGKSNTCAMCRSKLFDLPPPERTTRTAREMFTAAQNFLNGVEVPLPEDAPYMFRSDNGFLVITRPSAENGQQREVESLEIPIRYSLDDAGENLQQELDLVDLVDIVPHHLLEFLQDLEEEDDDEDLEAALRAWDMQLSPEDQQNSNTQPPAMDSTMLSPPIEVLSAGPFAHRPAVPHDRDQVLEAPDNEEVEFGARQTLVNETRREWSPTAPCGFGADSDSDTDSDSSVEDELEQEIELAGFEFENLVERHGEWVVSGFGEEPEDSAE